HRMRGLPFLLAHVEMVVTRRAPPVDAGGRLAGDETAILPEILSRSGAAAAMQAMNDGCGDAPRLENQARRHSSERAALAGCTLNRSTILVEGAPRLDRHPLIQFAPSSVQPPPR